MPQVETTTIKPTKKYNLPPGPNRIDFHGLDLFAAPVHISNHRFFQRPSTLKADDVIAVLQSSLAEALEIYAPVAGTARLDETGYPYLALDGEGAEFQVEIRDTAFVIDGEDLSPRPFFVLPTPSGMLAVKVTQFSCGTIAVASSLHHWLADLQGFLDFLTVWATIARGEKIDLKTIPQDWSHTPSRFFPKPSSPNPPPPYKFDVLPTVPTENPVFFPAEAQYWKVSAVSLAQLKNDFSPKNSAEWISSGDALTALLWGVITRARESAKVPRVGGFGRTPEELGTETLANAADGRERSPNKKMQYLGNFNMLFNTTVPRGDLLATDNESASRVALALRSSINKQLTAEAIADRIRFWEVPENVIPMGRVKWSSDCTFTNWCKFDLQGPEMDFGWGKPFDATSGAGMVPGGFARLLSNKSTGDVNVLIAVETEAVNALKNDSLFTKYATLTRIY